LLTAQQNEDVQLEHIMHAQRDARVRAELRLRQNVTRLEKEMHASLDGSGQ
jgi:hypothetical protein